MSLADFEFGLSDQVLLVKSQFLEGLLIPSISKFIFDSLKVLIFNNEASLYRVNFDQSLLHVFVDKQFK